MSLLYCHPWHAVNRAALAVLGKCKAPCSLDLPQALSAVAAHAGHDYSGRLPAILSCDRTEQHVDRGHVTVYGSTSVQFNHTAKGRFLYSQVGVAGCNQGCARNYQVAVSCLLDLYLAYIIEPTRHNRSEAFRNMLHDHYACFESRRYPGQNV